MNWRFVGYAMAGYGAVLAMFAYGALVVSLATPVDWHRAVALALFAGPIGLFVGAMVETDSRR